MNSDNRVTWMRSGCGGLFAAAACFLAIAGGEAQTIHYVNWANTTPATPYTNWASAATNIQDAIDASSAGHVVLVTNGIYDSGGITSSISATTCRVVIAKALAVRSVNGPSVTAIVGATDPEITNGPAAVRCVAMVNGAALAGFTVTNGAAYTYMDGGPGGVACDSTNSVISNCLITCNFAGGIQGGSLYNCSVVGNQNGGVSWSYLKDCRVEGNTGRFIGGLNNCTAHGCDILANNCQSAYGGGAANSRLFNCLVSGNYCGWDGGGAALSTCSNCTFRANRTGMSGGGTYHCQVQNSVYEDNQADNSWGGASIGMNYSCRNCLFIGNQAVYGGGAGNGGALSNCTIVGNTASNKGGGVFNGNLFNCIVYDNNAPVDANCAFLFVTQAVYTCAAPLIPGEGNIGDDPRFADPVSGNFRLSDNSPCVNRGTNAAWMAGARDLDGNPRLQCAAVDMGAYESAGWGQQSDLDYDSYNDWVEVNVLGTDPTNAASFLGVRECASSPAPAGGMVITWQSVAGKRYNVDRAGDLVAPAGFSTVWSNVAAAAGFTSVTDTTATAGGPWFYRIEIQP